MQDQIQNLPQLPGVYLFKNREGIVMYVGKAVNLFKRVSSYFQNRADHDVKVQQIANSVFNIDFILANSEGHALILECNLIKKYRPRFNVRLRDDKTFPYIKIDVESQWPRVSITRRIINDKAKYFGPFVNSSDVHETLHIIKRIFKFRSCKRNIPQKSARPCLNYHLGRCAAPCAGNITKVDYGNTIKQIIRFLEGRQESIIRDLKVQMNSYSRNSEFEKAAIIRDQIRAIQNIAEGQRIGLTLRGDKDAIAIANSDDMALAEVFKIRNNKLISKKYFLIDGTQFEDRKSILTDFIKLYYDEHGNIPAEILLQSPIHDQHLIRDWLRSIRNKPVRLIIPAKGDKKDLVNTVAQNAASDLKLQQALHFSSVDYSMVAQELRDVLGLSKLPERIEGYDISNIKGEYATGSMVVFNHGKPDKKQYKKFRIKLVDKIDDYSMIREILERRFSNYLLAEAKWAELPDLILIDGGKGHLHTACAVLQKLKLAHANIISLAKEKEEVFIPCLPSAVDIPRQSRTLHILQWV
ncbi:MAG TPA: excinuclease ABC subunit UvrC, partial [Dehalococcoidia bacterium]|nr:excinuclease ABC subunit UvrC [Dehalococcoidia bacterium]